MYSGQKYLGYPANHCETQSIAGYQVGFPIRKSADQRVLSPPHGLSQSATSFIASYRQGIHQTPFMRLIRSSKRKTKSGCAGLGVLFVHLPGGRPLRAGHSAGLVPRSTQGEHAQLQRSASLSQLAGRHSRQTTANYGQCIDLERHVF